MLGEAVLLHVVESAAFHLVRRGYFRLRFLKYGVIHPSQDLRVAFCALAAIRENGRFLLVRNLHRPESFGPFGGVFKHRDHSMLDHLEFRQDGVGADMQQDLRGFLPRKNLAALVAWFRRNVGREAADECLRREFSEEMVEVGLPKRFKCPEIIPILPIRNVQEGPSKVPGQAYSQYRIFEIYEPDVKREPVKKFCEQLLKYARKGNPDLLLASPQEIISGRSVSGSVIGHHAGYLLGKKRIRPESPMFNSQAASESSER